MEKKKRNIAAEILAKRVREGDSARFHDYSFDVSQVRDIIENPDPHNAQYARDLVVIRLVTLVEVFVRKCVRDIVDNDPSALERLRPKFGLFD